MGKDNPEVFVRLGEAYVNLGNTLDIDVEGDAEEEDDVNDEGLQYYEKRSISLTTVRFTPPRCSTDHKNRGFISVA